MSIKDVQLIEKEEVCLRLVQNNENIFDACSKAGIILSSTLLAVLRNTTK